MNETKPAPDLRKPPTSEVRRVAPPPGSRAVPAAAPPPQGTDPRKSSEARKPGSVTPAAPAARPPAHAAEPPEEDPEKFIREYADRQKTKVLRLEQQVGELRKVQTERDAFRSKGETLAKELLDARRQLDAAAKADVVIKDLQAKVDAALLSSSMDKDELTKLRAKVEALEASLKRTEDRAVAAERNLAETTRSLSSQTEARREAEARISAALHTLQSEPAARAASGKTPSAEATPGKPVERHASPPAAPPKPAVNFVRK